MNQPSFYIKKVVIENIFCFESITVDFSIEDNSLFFVLLGDNCTGKTAFLRCLALGLCDPNSAAVFMYDFDRDFIRRGQDRGTISIELCLPDKSCYRIDTTIYRITNSEEEDFKREYYYISSVGETIQWKNFPWGHMFVCGYGAGRVLESKRARYEQYGMKKAVGTLILYNLPLQDPELSLRRVVSQDQQLLQQFIKIIKDLLMFPGDVELTVKGIEMVGNGERKALHTYGDGYRNTLSWVIDFISWNMLSGRTFDPDTMTGIVLIDEIEQHLHPRQQRRIIPTLKKIFPKIQFIGTTHSPLTAGGSDKLVLFAMEDNRITVRQDIGSIRGWRVDQILTSQLFNLETSRDVISAKLLEEYEALFTRETLSPEEEEQLNRLEKELAALKMITEEGETERERKNFKIIKETMKEYLSFLTDKKRQEVLTALKEQLVDKVIKK